MPEQTYLIYIYKLKSILSKNNYPNNVIDFCIEIFLYVILNT